MRRTRSNGKASYASEYAGCFARTFVRLARLNTRHRYDLVQVHTLPDFLAFAALPAKITGARVVLDIHDLMPELYASKYCLDESSRTIGNLRRLERVSVGFCDHVITASEAFRDRLIARGVAPQKVSVVLNTADPTVFPVPAEPRPPRGPDLFTVFWHGTMVRRYGVDLALKACALLRGRIPGLRFILYGEGEESGRLRALADELRLGEAVEFRGYLPHTQLAPIMAQADLGVVPNLPDVHIDMAYPTKLFEFVQMGLPVVATRTPILERRFGEDSVLFCDPDEHSLAEGIMWVYENPELAQDRAAAARAICDEISWEKMSRAYVESVEKVLGGPITTAPSPV
jgi:glycosyltransferase involved in cell wall biosynthesis